MAFNATLVTTLQKFAPTRPAERARALADEIAQRKPDMVGLQEAFKFECLPMSQGQPDGVNCSQSEALTNRKSELSERIDMIFSLTPPRQVSEAKLLGEKWGDKTRPPGHDGLWPSDHAALAAELDLD